MSRVVLVVVLHPEELRDLPQSQPGLYAVVTQEPFDAMRVSGWGNGEVVDGNCVHPDFQAIFRRIVDYSNTDSGAYLRPIPIKKIRWILHGNTHQEAIVVGPFQGVNFEAELTQCDLLYNFARRNGFNNILHCIQTVDASQDATFSLDPGFP